MALHFPGVNLRDIIQKAFVVASVERWDRISRRSCGQLLDDRNDVGMKWDVGPRMVVGLSDHGEKHISTGTDVMLQCLACRSR